jgi:transcriptional regulator with XRE-family HTH domain
MAPVSVETEQVPKQNPPRLPSAEDGLVMRITYERLRRGWSADELARRLTDAGVPINQSAIWRIENATPRRKISLDEAVGFAKVFGMDLADLVGGDPDPAAAIIEQITAQLGKIRETSDLLRAQLREVETMTVAASAATAGTAHLDGGRLVGRVVPEPVAQVIRDLVSEFPWIEEPRSGEH